MNFIKRCINYKQPKLSLSYTLHILLMGFAVSVNLIFLVVAFNLAGPALRLLANAYTHLPSIALTLTSLAAAHYLYNYAWHDKGYKLPPPTTESRHSKLK